MSVRWSSLLPWIIVLGATAAILVVSDSAVARPERRVTLRNALRSDLVGCYKVMTAKGQLLDHHEFYNASPMAYLDSTARWHKGRNGPDLGTPYRVLLQLDSTGRSLGFERPISRGVYRYDGPSWFVDSFTDTVYMSFSTGFSGAVLILGIPKIGEDTLRGRIDETWDFKPFIEPHGRGMAVRVRCAA